MVSPQTLLVAAVIGNVTIKYREQGGDWKIEPALVRVSIGAVGYNFVAERTHRALRYLSGPARIDASTTYVVGNEAQSANNADLALIGSAESRLQTAPYLLLHLYCIIASLPPNVNNAVVAFAGGLPVEDERNPQLKELLRRQLTGRLDKQGSAIPHQLRWGDEDYTITIVQTSFVPQPIGAIATLLFTPDGTIQASQTLLRQRYALDIGGGTTDFTGRKGLELLPGTEGGIHIGVYHAVLLARELVLQRFPRLRQLEASHLLTLLRQGQSTLFVAGEPHDVAVELHHALSDTAQAIVAQVLPRWERTITQGEVVLLGGGGQIMAAAISALLSPITPVILLDDPLTRVADGIERLAKYQLRS